MKRREFIKTAAGAVAVLPVAGVIPDMPGAAMPAAKGTSKDITQFLRYCLR